ncbi:hypothetical protein [Gracilibacillus alcaliphilus]|uniref:hypothetical protein n=1 Tax=Gracilibacillus alcaliphilus TaxID=1401441 RepID=UPI00195DEBD2|nr:hypothetical protein [Gracilibacillus alcaliphilus]MBM7678554.1 hypothetical protein [Gracilibacillus alcaliphilus]
MEEKNSPKFEIVSKQGGKEHNTKEKDPIRQHYVELDRFSQPHVSGQDTFSYQKPPSFFDKYRSLLVSALIAILIGVSLGVIMLKIFIDLDPEEVAFQSGGTQGQAVTTKAQVNGDSSDVTFESKGFDFFVTQAGVFTEEGKAKELMDRLEAEGIKPALWQRDDHLHVFVSLHADEAGSKTFAEADLPENMEFYAGKQWQIPSASQEITDQDKESLEQLEAIITQLIEGSDPSEAINQWQETSSLDAAPIVKAFEQFEAAENQQTKQAAALVLLQAYEKLFQ